MGEKQAKKTLKQEIQKLKTRKNKLTNLRNTKTEKIQALHSEVTDLEKEITTINAELTEKEAQLKRAEYSTALQKLDDAALNKLSKRQAELLAEQILDGTIPSLLEDDNVATNSNGENDVVTSSNDSKGE